MKSRSFAFTFFALIAVCSYCHAGEPLPIKKEFIAQQMIVDKQNHFAMKINPALAWTVVTKGDIVEYEAVDQSKQIVYFVVIDRKDFGPPSQDNAREFFEGYLEGLKESHLTIVDWNLEKSNLPDKNAYRAKITTLSPTGSRLIIEKYVTAREYLYSITVSYPEGTKDKQYMEYLNSFRFLPK